MEGLLRWVISSMPKLPPRQHEHKRRYTWFTHKFILTRRIWGGWLWWSNDIRGPGGPKPSWHVSDSWGKIPKKPHPGNLSRPWMEPGPAAWQTRMLPPAPLWWTVDPGCPVVIILASGSEVRRLDRRRGRWVFSERKNPEYDFLRKVSKAVGPVS